MDLRFTRRLLLPLLLVGCSSAHKTPVPVKSPSLRGLITTGAGNIWASGTEGTVLRSTDDGTSWQTCRPPSESQYPDFRKLDFRGIYAWNAEHAILMAAGTGPLSRLYETTDACSSWHLLLTNPDPEGFWDTLIFSAADPRQGILLGDPVAGRFTLFRTSDAGQHWTRDLNQALASQPGEGVFAASNSSLIILSGTADVLFGTGGLSGARVFRFESRQNVWTSIALPVNTRNKTTGIFSIGCRSALNCIAVGGDYKRPQSQDGTAFLTRDGGRTWVVPSTPPRGYRSAVAWDLSGNAWVAAGPTGADVSFDNGQTWTRLDDRHWNTLSLPWAAGTNGLIARIPIASH